MLSLKSLFPTLVFGIIATATFVTKERPMLDTPGITTSITGDGKSFGSVLEIGSIPPSVGGSPTGLVKLSGQDQKIDDPCWYRHITAELGDDPLKGDDPSKGKLYLSYCPDAINLATGNLVYTDQSFVWVRNGQPLIPPPPNPGEIAQLASGQMTTPTPAMQTSSP